MISTYHINEQELTVEFLKSIKSLFKNKKLTVTIAEEIDETDYLLASQANSKNLQKSISDLENGKGTEFSIAQLKKMGSAK